LIDVLFDGLRFDLDLYAVADEHAAGLQRFDATGGKWTFVCD
jgi:hypothetical protein